MIRLILALFPLLQLKAGVELDQRHFEPEMAKIVDVVCVTAPKLRDGIVWITSAAEPAEGRLEHSLHDEGDAFDFRTRNVLGGEPEIRAWAARMQYELGDDYDVVVEEDHIHVEWDPDAKPEF